MILSVSQVEKFDAEQVGGCQRRWWFENVKGLKPDQIDAQSDGVKGHELLASWFERSEMPGRRVKMGKAVTAAILKGDLPTPGPDMIVESRFDGSPKNNADGTWNPVNVADTLVIGGVPFDGFIDLAYRRGDVPIILDHKFSSDINAYGKQGDALIRTVQMPVYVLSQMPYWPDADRWEIKHHYLSRSGCQSFIRGAVVHVDQVLERKVEIEVLVSQMKAVAVVESQDEVPFNRRACHAWLGCPMQSNCHAYRKNQIMLTPDEQAMLEGLDVPAMDLPPLEDEPAPVPVVSAKAAAIAKAKADLAALELEETPPVPAPKVRKIVVEDKTTPDQIPDSAPVASAPAAVTIPPCAGCAAPLTADNSSRLQTGAFVHVGCPKNAAPAPLPKARPPKAPAAPKVDVLDTAPDGRPSTVVLPNGGAPASYPTPVVQFELGPETIALIKALLSK